MLIIPNHEKLNDDCYRLQSELADKAKLERLIRIEAKECEMQVGISGTCCQGLGWVFSSG